MKAEERGRQLFMDTKIRDLPPLAMEYATYLCSKVGGCGEVLMTAYTHYAQAVENLVSEDSLYILTPEGKAWFKKQKK